MKSKSTALDEAGAKLYYTSVISPKAFAQFRIFTFHLIARLLTVYFVKWQANFWLPSVVFAQSFNSFANEFLHIWTLHCLGCLTKKNDPLSTKFILRILD